MKKRKVFVRFPLALLLAVFMVVLLLLTSCRSNSNAVVGARLVTPEELAALSLSLSSSLEQGEPSGSDDEKHDSSEKGTTLGTEPENQPDVVYWTPGGTVYHTDPECSSLKRSQNVLSGSVEQAWEEGKERVCSLCGKHDS